MPNADIQIKIQAYNYAKAELEKAEKDVERMGESAKKASTGMDRLGKSTYRLSERTHGLTTSVQGLRSTMSFILSGLLLSRVGQAVDGYTVFENKLKNVTDSAQELKTANEGIFKVAQDTRSGLLSTVTAYQRLVISTENQRISEERLMAITSGLNKSFIVSGATIQESHNAMIQLAQGLASGQLRGEEFRAVSEQGIRIIKALTASLGLSVGQLREMAYAGELTTKVFVEAFEKQLPKIDAEFREFSATLQQASVVAGNSFTNFVGKLDDATGSSENLVASILVLSDLLDDISDLDPGVLNAGVVGSMGVIGALLFGAEAATVIGAIVTVNETVKWLDHYLGTESSIGSLPDKYHAISEAIQDLRARYVGLNPGEGMFRGTVDEFGLIDAHLKAFFDGIDNYEAEKPTKKYLTALQKVRQELELIGKEGETLEMARLNQEFEKQADVLGKNNAELLKWRDAKAAVISEKYDLKGQEKARREVEKLRREIERADKRAAGYSNALALIGKEGKELEQLKLDQWLAGQKREIGGITPELRSLYEAQKAVIDEQHKWEGSGTWGALAKGFEDVAESGVDTFDAIGDAARESADSFTDYWTDSLWGAEMTLRDVLEAMGKDFTRLAISKSITEPLYGGLSDIFGSFVNHEGGVIGTGPRRFVPADTFNGARRYHSGGSVLGVGEVPVIAKAGEIILNAAQQQAVAGALAGNTFNFTASFELPTPSGDSGRDSDYLKEASTVMEKNVRGWFADELRNAQRPGGSMNGGPII